MPVSNDTDEIVEVEVENPGTGGPPSFGEWLAFAAAAGGAVVAIVGVFLGRTPLILVGVAILIVGVLGLSILRRSRTPSGGLSSPGASSCSQNGDQLAAGEQHPTPLAFLDGTVVRFCRVVDQQHQLIAEAAFSVVGGQLSCHSQCFNGVAIDPVNEIPWLGGENVLSLTGSWEGGYQVQLSGP